VQPVHDLLLSSRLHIVGEVVRPIAHCLIGCPGASFSKLTAVQSHPVALAQCERFFAAHAHLQRIAADDTAGSVREVIERGDLSRAAIAGEFAARVYGGRILRRHLEDHRKNFTRFFLLGTSARPARDADKLSVVFELRHQPGALLRALEPFARRGLNLLKIESRPIPGRPWEYRFYLDVRAHAGAPLSEALSDLQRASSRLRVLGHYPSARGR
jgi:prephenate dehydratase